MQDLKGIVKAIMGRRLLGASLGIRDFFAVAPRLMLSELSRIWRQIRLRRGGRHEDTYSLSQLQMYANALNIGLHRKDWEPGHSTKVHDAASELLKSLEHSKLAVDPTYIWAKLVTETWETAQKTGKRVLPKTVPQTYDSEEANLVFSVIRSRRSVRCFTGRPIDRDLLDQILSFATWGPASCCRQPSFLHIATENGLVQKCLQQCAGATGFSSDVPCFICACAEDLFYGPDERHLPLIDVTFGIQNVLLAAHACGIEGTVLSWAKATRKQEVEIRKLLSIPPSQRIVYCIAMGYPEICPSAPARKALELTRVYH